MTLLTIDPGYSKRGQGSACACFEDGELTRVWFIRPEQLLVSTTDQYYGRLDIVYEIPQVDGRTPTAAHEAIQLAAVGALTAGLYAGRFVSHVSVLVRAVTPAEWKSNLPKPICHMRVWDLLSPLERSLVGGDETYRRIQRAVQKGAKRGWPAGLDAYGGWLGHNTLDAVGIGCHELGRTT